MAKFKAHIITSGVSDIKAVEEKIRAKFEGAALRNFKAVVMPVLSDMVDRAITSAKDNFQPAKHGGDELIGKLGVGQGGEPLTDKLTNAWKLLLIGNVDSISKASLLLQRGTKFGTFKFTIDREAFYDASKTNYLSFQAKEFKKIPWMKHFLRGMPTIPDFRFVGEGDRGFDAEKSRTGLGIMKRTKVPSRQFSLAGYGEKKAFGAIEDAIKIRLRTGTFKAELKKSIGKALRKG